MKCRLFAILSALSLLLFVAVCVMWVRSKRTTDQVFIGRHLFVSEFGALYWAPGAPLSDHHLHESFDAGKLGTIETEWGNSVRRSRAIRLIRDPRRTWWCLILADWFVAFSLAAIPAVWLLRRRASRRRITHGLCPACGYDLRATPGRRPECGTHAAQ